MRGDLTLHHTSGFDKYMYDSFLGQIFSDFERYQATAEFLKSKTNYRPKIGIVCGTGLGLLAEEVKQADIFDYKNIPNFPVSTGKHNPLVFLVKN